MISNVKQLMDDTQVKLLESCFRASRAIHLLTAEATRRAKVLRLCCSDYQDAVDRLENLLEGFQEEDLDGGLQPEEFTKSDGGSFHVGQGATGRVSACDRKNMVSSDRTRSGGEVRHRRVDIVQDRVGHVPCPFPSGDDDKIDSCMSSESSSITESLQQVLEQARSIRAAATSTEDRIHPLGNAIKDVNTHPMTTMRGGLAPNVVMSAAARDKIPSSGRDRGKAASTKSPPASTSRSNVSTLHSEYDRTEWHLSQLDGERRTAATFSHSIPASGRREGSPSSTYRETYSTDEQKILYESEDVGIAGRSKLPSTAMLDFHCGMREEIARYSAASVKLSETGSGHDDESTGTRQDLFHEENALVGALTSEASSDTGSKNERHSSSGHLPGPHYLALRALLRPGVREEKSSTQVTHAIYAAGRLADLNLRPESARYDSDHATLRRKRTVRTAGGWEEVEQLQQSLLMLLDEEQGRRQLAAHEERRKVWDVAIHDSNAAGESTWENSAERAFAPLSEFEDWYAWNKVTHVSGLLRECVNKGNGNGMEQASLSKAARTLIENPRLALAGKNPLLLFRNNKSLDRHNRCQDWHRLKGAPGLDQTACFSLVQELRIQDSPCCPLERCWPHRRCEHKASESTREKRVEVFAQQLRTAALLAAETDVSTIVLPVLARALLHARQRERPPHIKTSTINSGLMRTPAEDRLGGMNWQNLGQVRQQVPERTAWGKEDKGCHRENEGNAAGEVIWAPTLAVFRAVEAILCGGGRPRTTFVCPKSDWTANLSSECNPSK